MESVGYRWRGTLFRLTAPSHARANGSPGSISASTLCPSSSLLALSFASFLRGSTWPPRVSLTSIRDLLPPARESNYRTGVFNFRHWLVLRVEFKFSFKSPRQRRDPWLRCSTDRVRQLRSRFFVGNEHPREVAQRFVKFTLPRNYGPGRNSRYFALEFRVSSARGINWIIPCT